MRYGYKIVDFKAGSMVQLLTMNFPPGIQNIILMPYDKAPATFVTGIKAAQQEVKQEAKAYFGNQ